MQNFIRGAGRNYPQYRTKGSTKKKWELEGVEKVTEENKSNIIKRGVVLHIIEGGVTIGELVVFPHLKPFGFYGLENYPSTPPDRVMWIKTGEKGMFGEDVAKKIVLIINFEIKCNRLYYNKNFPVVKCTRFKHFTHLNHYYKEQDKEIIEL